MSQVLHQSSLLPRRLKPKSSKSEEEEVINYESDLDEGSSLVGSTETNNCADDDEYEGRPLVYLGGNIWHVILQARTDLGEPLCWGTLAKDCGGCTALC
jgi:hypothetical protein